MRTYSHRFENEEGDAAMVRVNEETRHGRDGILIFVTGSCADTEVFVSPEEAREILRGLSKVLKLGSR